MPLLKRLFDPNHSVPLFIIGTAAVTLVLQWLYDLSKRAATWLSIDELVGASALAAVVLIIAAIVIITLRNQERSETAKLHRKIMASKTEAKHRALAMPRRGMIFTVGFQTDSVWNTIKLYQKMAVAANRQPLERIGLICTSESRPFANILRDQFAELCGLPGDLVAEIAEVDHLSNTSDVYNKTIGLVKWLQRQGLALPEIVVDATGGNVLLSIGIVDAADELHIDVQYTYSDFDKAANKRIPESENTLLVKHYLKD